MAKRVVPQSAPWITKSDKNAVLNALKARWLTGGPRAVAFEARLAKLVGSKHAIAVNSCTSALHLSLLALGIGPGDEVIVPTYTFCSSANAAIYCGAKPVLADIQDDTLNISPESLSGLVSRRTKAVVVVHFGGQSCDMEEILEITSSRNIPIVEDCAHSLGSSYHGRQTGTFGSSGCFSFYPTKNITTAEGGMVVTENERIANVVRKLRDHAVSRSAIARESGSAWEYDVSGVGYNYRLNEISAALGLSQLTRLRASIIRRQRLAETYTHAFAKHRGLVTPTVKPGRTHSFHLYAVRVVQDEFGMSRDNLFNRLGAAGIGAGVHYKPLHRMTAYRRFVLPSQSFPVADRVFIEEISLPIFPTMSESEQDYVIGTIATIAGRQKTAKAA